MDYIILCFGRTAFTKLTIDSILRNCGGEARIVLVNNGWNERLVPPGILKVWHQFVAQYRDEGKVHEVCEIESPTAGVALNAFSVPQLASGGRYHFITDNDCLILPGAAGHFDDLAVAAMDKNAELWKLGAFLYRKVSRAYCERFASEGLDLGDFLPVDWGNHERFCADDSGMQDYADYTKTPRSWHERDRQIWMIPSDTTLSIVRSPERVTEAHRLSPTLRSIEVLHVGYLESHFCLRTGVDDNMEFLHYHLLRPKVLLQFAADYQKRAAAYMGNLRKAGRGDLIDLYKERYVKRK